MGKQYLDQAGNGGKNNEMKKFESG